MHTPLVLHDVFNVRQKESVFTVFLSHPFVDSVAKKHHVKLGGCTSTSSVELLL